MGNIEKRRVRKKERRRKRMLKKEGREKNQKRFNIEHEATFEEKWELHFEYSGVKPYDGATCTECEEYLKDRCVGGRIPEDCISEKEIRISEINNQIRIMIYLQGIVNEVVFIQK